MMTDPPKKTHNIVVFGETGCGKSSIVNMLLGIDPPSPSKPSSGGATVSAHATGCTLSSTGYPGTINGESFTFWDTVGLNESDLGNTPDIHAVASLYHLLRKLKDGVSLLVFCMRAPRIRGVDTKNWNLFKDIICQGKVPVVLAITHLESELENMDAWWFANELAFSKHEIHPCAIVHRTFDKPAGDDEWVRADNTVAWAGDDDDESEYASDTGASGSRTSDDEGSSAYARGTGVACITATRGPLRRGEYMYEEEYKESCVKIRRLIYESHLPMPWKVEPVKWFQVVVQVAKEGPWLCPRHVELKQSVPGQGIFELLTRWGLRDPEEAKRIAKIMEEESSEES